MSLLELFALLLLVGLAAPALIDFLRWLFNDQDEVLAIYLRKGNYYGKFILSGSESCPGPLCSQPFPGNPGRKRRK